MNRELTMVFPAHGLDLSAPFSMQRSVKNGDKWEKLNTCHHAVNVRAYTDGVLRGGSRPGMSRYINAKVNSFYIVQMLSTMTYTDEDAVA